MFQGVATPNYEATVVASIQGFFAGLGRIWQRTGLRWGDVQVQALVSPTSKEEIDREATLIAIGSPGYNVVSQMIEKDLGAPARFANDNHDLETRNGEPVGDLNCFLVQRLTSQTTGQVVFYVAGPAREGTSAAVSYLLRDWRKLARLYRRDRTFCEVLRLTSSQQYVLTRRIVDRSLRG